MKKVKTKKVKTKKVKTKKAINGIKRNKAKKTTMILTKKVKTKGPTPGEAADIKMDAPAVIPSVPSMLAVCFDTETTGLVENRTLPLDKQPEIIEFYGAAVDLADGKIKAEVEFLIQPGRLPLPPEIIRITGITDKMLEGRPSFRKVAPSIIKLLSNAPVVIAHNLSFDKDMVEIELQRLEKLALVWPHGICTVEQSLHLKGHRLSMGNLYQFLFNETFIGAHRARADVAGLIRIATEMHRREMI